MMRPETRPETASGVGPTSIQNMQYDAAGRLVTVSDASNNLLASYVYGSSNQRLITTEYGTTHTYYVAAGDSVISEYQDTDASPQPQWTKSYVYLGARLLATIQPLSPNEYVQYQHPDRLGTRLMTNNQDSTFVEQVTLPYGTALGAESTGASNRRFTCYDRSSTTGLDYAVNRHYDSEQGRFTQVDPSGMGAANIQNPQSLNMYAYCGNDPINHLDPSGLGFFSSLFGWIGAIFKALVIAVAIFVAVIATVLTFAGGVAAWKIVGLYLLSALNFGLALGPEWLKQIVTFGAGFQNVTGNGPRYIIWNFINNTGPSRTGLQFVQWASNFGVISSFQQETYPGALGGQIYRYGRGYRLRTERAKSSRDRRAHGLE